MGQHKHNPTAQAAKRGELPTKKKPMSKKERERRLNDAIMRMIPKLPGWWKGRG